MRTVFRILFLVPIGFILACYGAAFALLWPFLSLSDQALSDPFVVVELAFGFTAQAAQVGWTALLPFVAFFVVSETFSLRGVLVHLLAGLAGGLAACHLGPAPAELSLQTAQIVAGLSFALIYWIVAGHRAGLWRQRAPASLPAQRTEP